MQHIKDDLFMNEFLHTVFVVAVNIVGWGLLVAGVIAFLWVLWRLLTKPGKNGSLPWL